MDVPANLAYSEVCRLIQWPVMILCGESQKVACGDFIYHVIVFTVGYEYWSLWGRCLWRAQHFLLPVGPEKVKLPVEQVDLAKCLSKFYISCSARETGLTIITHLTHLSVKFLSDNFCQMWDTFCEHWKKTILKSGKKICIYTYMHSY